MFSNETNTNPEYKPHLPYFNPSGSALFGPGAARGDHSPPWRLLLAPENFANTARSRVPGLEATPSSKANSLVVS